MEQKEEMENKEHKSNSKLALYVAVGVCFGVAIGSSLNQIGLGISLGLLGGIVVWAIVNRKKKKDKGE